MGETLCTLESVKAVGEVYAPTDCEVVEMGTKLSDEPATVNSAPEADGWLVKVKFSGDLSSLMDRTTYDKHVEAEAKEERALQWLSVRLSSGSVLRSALGLIFFS